MCCFRRCGCAVFFFSYFLKKNFDNVYFSLVINYCSIFLLFCFIVILAMPFHYLPFHSSFLYLPFHSFEAYFLVIIVNFHNCIHTN